MGVDYGWEKFYKALRYAMGSNEPVQERLASVISGVHHLNRDSFPDDETYEKFQTMVKASTMVPAKANEGTIRSSVSHMKDGEATLWLETAFDIFTKIAESEAHL
jgi:hypothetical protein